MSEADGGLYEELGVAPSASQEELRAGYRRRARTLHPDLAPEGDTGEAMRRLNQAWAVLGDPERRRRYDEARPEPRRRYDEARPEPPAAASPPSPSPPLPSPGEPVAPAPRRRIPFLRPSVLVLLILAAIFVVTAYAGSWPGTGGGAPTSPTSAGASLVRPVGQCLSSSGVTGPATIGPCTSPSGAGQIVAEVPQPADCPSGTVAHAWSLRPTVLCATAISPSGRP